MLKPTGSLYNQNDMAKKAQPIPKTFEEALGELEQILADIESGQTGLEESLIKYERGTFLIGHCRSVLGAAEQQIEVLTRKSDGTLTSTPLPPEPESGE